MIVMEGLPYRRVVLKEPSYQDLIRLAGLRGSRLGSGRHIVAVGYSRQIIHRRSYARLNNFPLRGQNSKLLGEASNRCI